MQIDLTIKNYRCFAETKPAKITIRDGFIGFVGVNNSGKSTLLKLFFELRAIFQQCSEPTHWPSPIKNTYSFTVPPQISDITEIFCNENDHDITIDMSLVNDLPDKGHLKQVRIAITRDAQIYQLSFPTIAPVSPDYLVNVTGGARLEIRSVDGAKASLQGSLADLCEAMRMLSKCCYIGAFRNAINVGTKADYFDIQVGQGFIKQWREYKTGAVKKHNKAADRLTQDIARLFGIARLEINPTPDDTSLQVLMDGQPFKLTEIGGGIAQFIVVLANVAIKQPTFVLIDEPELSLHPTLQLDFLTTIGSWASHGVLFSTHNIGLARSSADRIYSVRMSNGVSEVRDLESTPQLSEFLGEVSYSGYRELGFDKILLVEGPTEVKAVQQLLRLYSRDHKVVLLSLGGSDMINGHSEAELQEVKRISENVHALIDSERESATAAMPLDREAFKSTCSKVGIPCCILERRAFENYFPEHAIHGVRGNASKPLGELESLKKRGSDGWPKRDNWRIARQMNREDLDGTDLGAFLESL